MSTSQDRLKSTFDSMMTGSGGGVDAADRLCQACVDLLDVDGAAISLMHDGSTQGTFGSSGELSRRLDEFQFSFGEGPCLDAVSAGRPVLVGDLVNAGVRRWPAYSPAVVETGVHGVFALPIIANTRIGALDLFRYEPRQLSRHSLVGGLIAAQLASLPLLDLMSAEWGRGDDDANDEVGWSQLASLERVEVYQATGMVMAQLGVSATEALVRLRARSVRHRPDRQPARLGHRRTPSDDGRAAPRRASWITTGGPVIANREREITESFVSLASSLVDGADVVDLLGRLTADCARLLDISSGGLLLADGRGVLHVMAASSEATRNLELFQLQRDEGPCLECFHTGSPVSVPDLSEKRDSWPQFVGAATAAGVASAHVVPMRLRDNVLGALGLFSSQVGALGEDDLRLAQALASVASVALVQDKVVADSGAVAEQLQSALSSRVVLEQAKGLLAQSGDLSVDEAFVRLRSYARQNNLRLGQVSQALVDRELSADALLDGATARHTA